VSNFMLLDSSKFLLNIKSDNYIPLGISYNFKRVFRIFDIFISNIKIRLIEMENITMNRVTLYRRLRLKSVNYTDISI